MDEPTLDKFPKKVLASIGVETAFIVSRLVVAAERLQLFRLLGTKHLKASAIGRALNLHNVYLRAFLNSMVALGLLSKANDVYWNTPFTKKYFIEERSIYWTREYSKECVEAYEALAVLENALTSGRSCKSIKGLDKPSYTEAMKRDRRRAEDFTQMLFHYHRDDATALANYLDLSKRRAVLDVGGGSGVMSIALAQKNPHLRACILDIAPVCQIAAANIRHAGLSRRIATRAGDIRHRLPAGFDVIMFCDIGAVSKQLLENAYDCLPANGLIVLVDRYLSRDGTKPLARLVAQFVGFSFPLASWADIVDTLKSCGFRLVKARKVYRDVWFITGTKPNTRRATKPRPRWLSKKPNNPALKILTAVALLAGVSASHAQATLTADGHTPAYASIEKFFHAGPETPDCSHPQFGPHITEAIDSELGKYVFVFHIHVTPDNDRCKNFDRQRLEIKAEGSSPDGLKGFLNDSMTYRWLFRLPEGFRPSEGFTHIHQIKAFDGDAGAPLITLTPRAGATEHLQIIHIDSHGKEHPLTEVQLEPFIGQWVEAYEKVTYGAHGSYSLVIRRVKDGAELLTYSTPDLDLWRKGTTVMRPKWGIYRSLKHAGELRDEQLRFDDFCIAKGKADCTARIAADAKAVGR